MAFPQVEPAECCTGKRRSRFYCERRDRNIRDVPYEVGKCPLHSAPAAEHLVAVGTDIGYEGLDLVPGNEILVQHDCEDLHRGLEFLGNHLIGAGIVKRPDFADITRAHNNGEGRVEVPAETNDPAGRYGIIDSNNCNPGPRDAGMGEYPFCRCIAKHHGLALLPGSHDKVRVELDDIVQDAGL